MFLQIKKIYQDPLIIAVQRGYTEIVKLLLTREDLDLNVEYKPIIKI